MEFYGLLGEKLSHSLSPEIHKKIFDYIKKDGAYKLFQIEQGKLEGFVESVKLLDINGFNITIPYKQDIMRYLDFTSEEALKIGAINTVVVKNKKLYGYNTDYFGFGEIFKKNNISFKDKKVVILGTGGACKSAMNYILDNEVNKLYIVSRNINNIKTDKIRDRVEFINYEELKNISGDILINSTPVGMYPNVDDSPVDKDVIKNFNVLMDIVYNPLETSFLKLGKEEGKIVLDGLYMLVAQAVKAEEIFYDIKIDDNIIEKIYNDMKKYFEK